VPSPNPGGLRSGDVLTPLNIKVGANTITATVPSGGTIALNPKANLGFVNAIVYGGRQGAAPMADVGYVGTNSKLYVRQAAQFGAFAAVTSWNKGGVVALAADPTDWRHIYVLDSQGRVWFSSKGDASPTSNWNWVQLTGRLGALPGAKNLQSIAIANDGNTRVILVGGAGGAYRKVGNDPWSEYGAGLPNVLTTDIDVVSTAPDNVLLAGTMGRGAWTIPPTIAPFSPDHTRA